jgi:hypothetical protein
MKILMQMGTGAYKIWHLKRFPMNHEGAIHCGSHNMSVSDATRIPYIGVRDVVFKVA